MKDVQKLFFYLLVLVGSLLIVITLTSLIYNSSLWFLQVLNFPRLDVLITLVICLVSALLYPKKRANLSLLAGLVVAIAIQAYIIFPYTILGEKAVGSAPTTSVHQPNVFSIMLANVLITNRHAADLLKIIASKDPTFVLTMEVNDWWISQLSVLKKRYPYSITYPAKNAYGMALYSKLPLNHPQILFLNHDKVPSFNISITLPDRSKFQLVTIHPVAPAPSKYPTNIGGKEVALLKAGHLVAKQASPTVVAGDFNDVGWSHNTEQFATISGLHDVRYGRGMYNTFDANSWLFRWPLDYVFVSSQFKVLTVERLPKFGSDHFPYYVQLVLQP
ncbi:MAG: endonuclease/exonuclease/phosphatase family protein [Cytophagaceae bacterium]|nr:MAG: endonuclease/exonuclease/phosphatase family protein [Cytophagaceae bacterium]